MLNRTIVWTGENQIDISNFIGNEDFWHKGDQLLIQQKDEPLILKKGDLLIKDEDGKVHLPLSKTSYRGEACSNEEELAAALEVVERRINERLYSPSGDRTAVLNAISLLSFWAMPLQNSAEALGFDDYLGAFVRTSFDTEQCKKSWEVDFLKAHKVDRSKHQLSVQHAEKLLAELTEE